MSVHGTFGRILIGNSSGKSERPGGGWFWKFGHNRDFGGRPK